MWQCCGRRQRETPVPYKEDALLVNCLTKSQPEGTPHSSSKQCEPVNPVPTGSTSPDSVHEELQSSHDTPVPLRWSLKKMRNQLPWRYQNFAVWQNDTLPDTLNMWVGLCICLYIMSYLYTVFVGSTVWRHSTWNITGLPDTNYFWHWWGHHQCWLYSGFLDGRSEWKVIWSKCSCPTRKTKGQLPIEALWVSGQCKPKSDVHGKIMRERKNNLHTVLGR